MSADQKKRKGRDAFAPTDEQRALVRRMVGEQALQPAIAAAVGVSLPTLRKAFAAELADKLAASHNLFAAADAAPPTVAPPGPRADGRGRGGGRPRFQPSDSQRDRARELVAVSSGEAEAVRLIAALVQRSEPTVRRAFRAELQAGRDLMHAAMVHQMFRAARAGKVPAIVKALDMMGSAAIAELADRVTAPAAVLEPKGPPPGKKQLAEQAAGAALTSGAWAELLKQDAIPQ